MGQESTECAELPQYMQSLCSLRCSRSAEVKRARPNCIGSSPADVERAGNTCTGRLVLVGGEEDDLVAVRSW